MEKYLKFRSENPVFLYKSFNIDETETTVDISYSFEIPELMSFNPSWSFPKPSDISIKNDPVFEKMAFSLGMAEAVSYWKAVCSPLFRVECGTLTEEQAEWWKKLWFMGLGEFFYVNGINADRESFVEIVSDGKFRCDGISNIREMSGCLVPIGGGKDSALTLETLINHGNNCICYSINSRRSISATVEKAGLSADKLITAKRNFDRSLIELNNKGYLNGHTPFSSIVAFSTEITAYLFGRKYIVLSNEASANESTVSDVYVNHQYSKSFEFEKDFHSYEETYFNAGIYYFSFLRPLSEFQIAKMFVSHRKYLPVFRSCNLGSKVSPDIWCADCPKCLFVSLILSPFITDDEQTEIFGKNLIDSPDMLTYFEQLIGMTEHKPFECVGSISEVRLAVSLYIRKHENRELPLLMREFIKRGLYCPENLDAELEKYLSFYNSDNLLPPEFSAIIKNEMERLL
jgi:hypothetical protein